MCGSETWILSQSAAQIISSFKRKLLWEIHGLKQVTGVQRNGKMNNCTDCMKTVAG